ncbi:MAG: hypothetical protein P1P87_12840, partial [Trueperaceae bacterium]|nr:hypothetical protein [Trueperaceae bacterium]
MSTQPEALETRHLLDLAFVADPRLASFPVDGAPRRAVATVTTVVPGAGDAPPRYRTRLQAFEVGDAATALAQGAEATADLAVPTRALTAGERDTAPRWSPDG